MVRYFLTKNINHMKNRSYTVNMSCKINLTEWLKEGMSATGVDQSTESTEKAQAPGVTD